MKRTVLIMAIWITIFSSLISGCNQSSDPKKFKKFISSFHTADSIEQNRAEAEGAGAAHQLPSSNRDNKAIVSGTPIAQSAGGGSCGDGVIDANEHCDQRAMPLRDCSELAGGLYGPLRCGPDCRLDIGACLTVGADKLISRTVETCECACESTPCRGGCQVTEFLTQSECRFDCDTDCQCNCEGKLGAHIEECYVRSTCIVDDHGIPDCNIYLTQCELLVTIEPYIVSKVAAGLP